MHGRATGIDDNIFSLFDLKCILVYQIDLTWCRRLYAF